MHRPVSAGELAARDIPRNALPTSLKVVRYSSSPAPSAAFKRPVRRRPPATMTKRWSIGSMQVSSGGCSNGEHKRLLRQGSSSGACAGQEHAKKVRLGMRTDYTYAPYHDGFQWRKYGQKMIRGKAFPRNLTTALNQFGKKRPPYIHAGNHRAPLYAPHGCYYRCTYHHDHGCPASKHVDQHNSEDPPVFRVVYTNDHTCSGGGAAVAASEYMASSMQIQQIADASLRKEEMEIRPPPPPRCGGGYAPPWPIKEEKDAIVSSLVTVIGGACDDIAARSYAAPAPQDEDAASAALLASDHCTPAPVAAGSSVSGVRVLPAAPDDPGLEFMLESHWFEPLDLGWYSP